MEVVKLDFESSTPNKIQEIKWFRNAMEERYGVSPGLKESKEMIEHMGYRQKSDALLSAKLSLQSLPPYELRLLADWINSRINK